MTDSDLPVPDREHVPDTVLDELMAAFAGDPPEAERAYDFDDPSIDRLLGLDPNPPGTVVPGATDEPGPEPAAEPVAEPGPEPAAVPEPEPEPEPARPPAPVASRRTIVIPEDDQPDTVYLDMDKEERFLAVHSAADGERSTIIISDLDDGTVVEPAPTKGSAGIDPRIRARRIAVRRSESRRRLLWVGVAAAVVLLLVGAIAVVASPIFDVRDVRVQGAVYTDADLLADVIADVTGDPVLLVDTGAIEDRLEEVPWVERARASIDFPHTVVIDIRERRPLAAFQGSDERWRVIDVQGRVLDVIDGQPIAYVPITGNHPDTARGQFAGAPYASAAVLVAALPAEIREITESVGLDAATGTLTMQLAGDIEVRLGDDKDLDEKLARLLNQVRDGLDGVAALDVSTAEIGVVPR